MATITHIKCETLLYFSGTIFCSAVVWHSIWFSDFISDRFSITNNMKTLTSAHSIAVYYIVATETTVDINAGVWKP